MTTTKTTTVCITVDPKEPFAGLVCDEDVGDLPDEVRVKGPRAVAVDLLTAASAAGCGTWDDVALATLTKALELLAAEDGVEDECDDCGRTVIWREDEPPPAVDDDAAWATLAGAHNDDCEWVRTRAHRLDTDARDVLFIDVTTGEQHTDKGATQVIEVSASDLGQYDGGGLFDTEAKGRDTVSLSTLRRGEYALIRDETGPIDERGHVWWLSQIVG